jgi:hypothetical protein
MLDDDAATAAVRTHGIDSGIGLEHRHQTPRQGRVAAQSRDREPHSSFNAMMQANLRRANSLGLGSRLGYGCWQALEIGLSTSGWTEEEAH